MKKLIIGIIIGFVLSSTIAYAYRIQKPLRLTDFDQKNLVTLNAIIEGLWDISNGRWSPDTGSAASTGTGTVKMGSVGNANSAGWFKFYKSNGTIVYIPYWTDDTP